MVENVSMMFSFVIHMLEVSLDSLTLEICFKDFFAQRFQELHSHSSEVFGSAYMVM